MVAPIRWMVVFFQMASRSSSEKSLSLGLLTPPSCSVVGASEKLTSSSTNRPHSILRWSPGRSQSKPRILGRRVAPLSGSHPFSHPLSWASRVMSILSLLSAALST